MFFLKKSKSQMLKNVKSCQQTRERYYNVLEFDVVTT